MIFNFWKISINFRKLVTKELLEIKENLKVMNATLATILDGQKVEKDSLNNLGQQVADLVATDTQLKIDLANTDPEDKPAQLKIAANQKENNDSLLSLLAKLPTKVSPQLPSQVSEQTSFNDSTVGSLKNVPTGGLI